eukprot:2068063-Pyramimonas_sp.AAC.1
MRRRVTPAGVDALMMGRAHRGTSWSSTKISQSRAPTSLTRSPRGRRASKRPSAGLALTSTKPRSPSRRNWWETRPGIMG